MILVEANVHLKTAYLALFADAPSISGSYLSKGGYNDNITLKGYLRNS